jgi:hypothetical protein
VYSTHAQTEKPVQMELGKASVNKILGITERKLGQVMQSRVLHGYDIIQINSRSAEMILLLRKKKAYISSSLDLCSAGNQKITYVRW